MKGTVKWFNDDKGYGFITPEDGGKDAFVHHSEIVMNGRRTLEQGQAVTFEVEKTSRGRAAKAVVPDYR